MRTIKRLNLPPPQKPIHCTSTSCKNILLKDIFLQLTKTIDENGSPLKDADNKPAIETAEALAERLLGSTLHIRRKKFIIRMLEIYYGGIGDRAHDWYRTRYVYKTSKYKQQTAVQEMEGFKIYLSNLNVIDPYTRMDIVGGNDGVAISFLLRSVWDENFNLIGAKHGSPNKILQAMGLQSSDHGADISVDDPYAGFFLEDSGAIIRKEKNLLIEKRLRINLNCDFEKEMGLMWNYGLG